MECGPAAALAGPTLAEWALPIDHRAADSRAHSPFEPACCFQANALVGSTSPCDPAHDDARHCAPSPPWPEHPDTICALAKREIEAKEREAAARRAEKEKRKREKRVYRWKNGAPPPSLPPRACGCGPRGRHRPTCKEAGAAYCEYLNMSPAQKKRKQSVLLAIANKKAKASEQSQSY